MLHYIPKIVKIVFNVTFNWLHVIFGNIMSTLLQFWIVKVLKSATQIANQLNLGKQGEIRVPTWARIYQVQGEKAFSTCKGNRSYSREFKIMVVNEYLSGKSSLRMIKYNIPANTTIQRWIMKYNNHIELKNRKYKANGEEAFIENVASVNKRISFLSLKRLSVRLPN